MPQPESAIPSQIEGILMAYWDSLLNEDPEGAAIIAESFEKYIEDNYEGIPADEARAKFEAAGQEVLQKQLDWLAAKITREHYDKGKKKKIEVSDEDLLALLNSSTGMEAKNMLMTFLAAHPRTKKEWNGGQADQNIMDALLAEAKDKTRKGLQPPKN